jgi:hypothetical protein
MVNTLREFVHRIESLEQVGDAYYVFEGECSEELRTQIWLLSDIDSPEPFRSAMINMGFVNY